MKSTLGLSACVGSLFVVGVLAAAQAQTAGDDTPAKAGIDRKKDMHIHGLRITFHKDGRVTSAWDGYAEGKKMGTTKFVMTRQ